MFEDIEVKSQITRNCRFIIHAIPIRLLHFIDFNGVSIQTRDWRLTTVSYISDLRK